MQAQVCVIGIKGENTGDIVLQRGVRGRFFDVKTHLNIFFERTFQGFVRNGGDYIVERFGALTFFL